MQKFIAYSFCNKTTLYLLLLLSFNLIAANSKDNLDSLKGQETVSISDPLWNKPSSDILENELWEGSDWNLAELLEMQSDFAIKRLGPKGSYSLFSRSGIPGSSIRVIIDGIPQNPPGGGYTNLEILNLNDIESVELNRQSNNKHMTGAWPGGSISLTSKAFEPGISASLLYGSFEHLEGNFNFKQNWGKVQSSFFASHLSSQNNYSIFSNNNTPYNTEDDSWITLENAAQENWKVGSKLGFNNWYASTYFQSVDMGIPGYEGARNPTASFHSQKIETALGTKNPKAPFKLAYQYSGDYYKWGTQDKFWREVEKPTEVGQLNQRIYSATYLKAFSYLHFPMEASWEYIEPRTNNDLLKVGLNWTAERYSFDPSITSYSSWKALEFEIKYHLNFRQESAKNSKDTLIRLDKEQSWHSAYGSKAYIIPNTQTQFWLGFERTHLAPSLVQRFGGGQGALGNHSLKDEQGWLIETGRAYKSKLSTQTFSNFRVRPFWQLRNDAIQYFISSGLSKALNTGRMEIWAIEFSENIKHPQFGFSNTVLFQSAKWTGGPSQTIDNTPPDTPQWILTSKLHIKPFNSSFKLLNPIKLASSFKMQGMSFKDNANQDKIDSYFLWNFRLMYSPDYWNFSLGVNNIFDKITENGYSTFPTEGRSFYTKISFNLLTQQTPKEEI